MNQTAAQAAGESTEQKIARLERELAAERKAREEVNLAAAKAHAKLFDAECRIKQEQLRLTAAEAALEAERTAREEAELKLRHCWDTHETFERLAGTAQARVRELEGPAKPKYDKHADDLVHEPPLERLRYYCSIALNHQDWLDIEELFDDVEAQLATAKEEERERCAKLAQGMAHNPPSPFPHQNCIQIAAAIRALKDQP